VVITRPGFSNDQLHVHQLIRYAHFIQCGAIAPK